MIPFDNTARKQAASVPRITPDGERMGWYRAYGLAIRSQIPLPEFSPAEPDRSSRADLTVVLGCADRYADTPLVQHSAWSLSLHQATFCFKGVAVFVVRRGSEIVVSPEPGVDHTLLRMYIEGMMMACVLYQRGFFVLHASVIQIGSHGIGFLGHVGAGKSTLAAALHARGHAVVTDDNAAIDMSGSGALVTPAFPSVKVYPAIAASLGYDEQSLQVMHDSQVKRARSVSRAFPEIPVALRQLYVLDRSESEELKAGAPVRLAPAAATLELIRNSVPTRWRQPGDALHLMRCGQLSRQIPISRIRSFKSLDDIPALARRIEEDDRAAPAA
jgi:hypothetical protein